VENTMITAAQENEQFVRRILEDVLEQGNLDAVDEMYTEDVVEHTPMGDFSGREAIKDGFRMIHEAVPDYTVTLEDIVAAGDTVAVRLTERGTHTGTLLGIDPTGNEFEHQTMAFLRIEQGRVAEWWVLPDNLGLLKQLGAFPEDLSAIGATADD
jgi:predicted ester cyclase